MKARNNLNYNLTLVQNLYNSEVESFISIFTPLSKGNKYSLGILAPLQNYLCIDIENKF